MARVAGVEASAVPGRITGEQSLRGNSFVKMRSLAPGPLVLHTSSANTEIVHERRRRRGPASAGLVTRAQQMVPADSSAPSAIPAPPWTPRFLILGEGARLSRRAAPTRHSARQAASRCCLGAQRDGRACEPAGVTEVLVLTSRIRTTPERLFDLSLDMAATGRPTAAGNDGYRGPAAAGQLRPQQRCRKPGLRDHDAARAAGLALGRGGAPRARRCGLARR